MRIAIAGAGIAGLAAAIALARRGFRIDVFERAAAFDDIGAGIQLSPNAMAVLEALGLVADLGPSLVEPREIAIHDGVGGARLCAIPLGPTARRRYGAPYCVIHRADLHAALLRAAGRDERIAIRMNADVEQVQASASGVSFVTGADPGQAEFLIAADGIHSRLRGELFGYPPAALNGRLAWRATLAAADVPGGFALDATGLWLAPGAHLVHYPVRAGAELNLVFIAAHARSEPPHGRFGAAIRPLLDAVPAWRQWPLYDFDLARPWARGRVLLVGDAAHAMLPSAAQGGAQAIEDAWVLAECLAGAASRPNEAMRRFEEARRRRVRRVAAASRRNLAMYEWAEPAASLRNTSLRLLPASFHLARLDWLYAWRPQKNA